MMHKVHFMLKLALSFFVPVERCCGKGAEFVA